MIFAQSVSGAQSALRQEPTLREALAHFKREVSQVFSAYVNRITRPGPDALDPNRICSHPGCVGPLFTRACPSNHLVIR